MFSPIVLAFAIASLAVVKAVDLCAYSNFGGCSGSSVCCSNFPENTCCELPDGYGFSVGYTDLPGPVSVGQAWSSRNCVAEPVNTEQIGTGDKCFAFAGKINSIAWTISGSKRENVALTAEAVQPNVFKFTVEGVEKTIKIPAGEGTVDAVISLFKGGNFTALAAYGPAA